MELCDFLSALRPALAWRLLRNLEVAGLEAGYVTASRVLDDHFKRDHAAESLQRHRRRGRLAAIFGLSLLILG